VQRQADAVIGYAVLREIVGADFFGAVAGFDLSTAFGGERGLALLLSCSYRRARRTRMAFERFLICDFSSCCDTTSRWERA